jgi:hypothetical protein
MKVKMTVLRICRITDPVFSPAPPVAAHDTAPVSCGIGGDG